MSKNFQKLYKNYIVFRDLCTCACVKAVKVDCSKSSFEMFRSDSDDFFGLVEEKNLKSKISIFSLAEVLPMVCDILYSYGFSIKNLGDC